MATISAMSRQTHAIYSMFNRMSSGSISSSELGLMNSFFGGRNSRTKSTSLSSALYSYYNANSSTDLQNLQRVTSGIRNLASSYNQSKKTFNTEYNSNLTELKKSATAVRSQSFSFSSADITTDDSGNKTYSKELSSAIKSVKDLVGSYNETISFLNDNKSTSNQVQALANSFADSTYFTSSYDKVGIKVNTAGKLSLDEARLAKALTENPKSTESTLKYTFAARADSKATLGQMRSATMFPSMNSLIGSELGVASLYSGRTPNNIQRYANSYNIFNILV